MSPGAPDLLATAHGIGAGAERVGVLAVAVLAGVFVLGGAARVAERPRALAALAVLTLTPLLLVIDIWNTSQLRHLRHHPAEAAAAVALAAVLFLALALFMYRRPAALALLAVGALPFRLPISTGGSTANLLLPLYLVVGAGALAHAVARLRADAREQPPALGLGRLEWLLVASVVLYAAQAAYSSDFNKALENVVFFYVPFALLFGLLRRMAWTPRLLVACLGVVVVEALLFAGVGFVEYSDKHLLLNPKVVQADQYGNYFRVNSLFFDPSIYGRFLALVMLLITTVLLWTRRRREVLIGGLVLAWLLAGLITSFSQTSIAALLLGLAVLAARRWNVRDTLLVCLALAAIALLVVLFAPPSSHLGLSGSRSADNATSGRYTLVRNGVDLFAERPLEGFGPGSFPLEYRRRHRASAVNDATSASHTIPITVAAEQGLIGLALYVALLLAACGRLFSGAARSPARIALGACFVALVAHTFAYADFLEDPLTWTLLGVGAALASGRAASVSPAPAV